MLMYAQQNQRYTSVGEGHVSRVYVNDLIELGLYV